MPKPIKSLLYIYQMLQVELLPLLESWTNLPALTVIGFTIKQEDRKQP